MSKFLFLYRHAEAAQGHSNDGDRDRELTARGISHANLVGSYLLANDFTIKVIFTSTALRAHQTAAITAEAMKISSGDVVLEENLYNATTRTFFEFIGRLDSAHDRVMCVGHNPTITYLAEYLTRESIGDIVPAGVAVIRFDLQSWNEVSQGNGQLVKYITPETIQ